METVRNNKEAKSFKSTFKNKSNGGTEPFATQK